MKFLLAAINAKYIHSNPGVYSLRAFARTKIPGADIEIGEYTINHPDGLNFTGYLQEKAGFYRLFLLYMEYFLCHGDRP